MTPAAPSLVTEKVITKSGGARSRQRPIVVDAKIKSRHTANGILKDAGIALRFR